LPRVTKPSTLPAAHRTLIVQLYLRIQQLTAGVEEDAMAGETTDPLAAAIRDHLELKRRNSVLEDEMPLANYTDGPWPTSDDPTRDDQAPEEAITEELATSPAK
jgi:hypothetical protein